MGWLFTWNSTKEELLVRLRSPSRFVEGCELLQSSVVGNNHWYLLKDKTGLISIGLDKMAAGGKNEGWGYKDMSEFCGPVEVNCPLGFLAKASPPTGYAIEWREKVRAYHAKRKEKKTLTPGIVLKYGPHCYRLDRPAGARKGWNVYRLSDSMSFRMSAKQVCAAVVVSGVV